VVATIQIQIMASTSNLTRISNFSFFFRLIFFHSYDSIVDSSFAATPRSFLQAVATEEVATPLRAVQMEGLVSILLFLFYNSIIVQFLVIPLFFKISKNVAFIWGFERFHYL
jgi:hypothetical protein